MSVAKKPTNGRRSRFATLNMIFWQHSWRKLIWMLVWSGGLHAAVAVVPATVSTAELHGRSAYALGNGIIQVSMLSGGGYIGEMRFLSSDPKKAVNPLRVPHYQTIDPQDYVPALHDQLYGSGSDRKLMAGYMGQYLCFPYFGGANSPGEEKLGFSKHGEAIGVKWEIEPVMAADGTARIAASADLPLTHYKVRRTIALSPGQSVVRVDEEVENLEGFDRPYQWSQHLTFGDPFLASNQTFADAPVAKIAFSDNRDEEKFDGAVAWPLATNPAGHSFDASVFGVGKGEGAYRSWLMDPARTHTWVTLYNREYHVLIGYVFSKAANPWIVDWQENCRVKQRPWNGQVVARALVVGTSPFGTGVKRSIQRGSIFDTPTVDWIGAYETRRQSYLIFLAEIDAGFKGVERLLIEDGSITLIERGTGRQIRVDAGGKP